MTNYNSWVNYTIIGRVHSPYTKIAGTPIQPNKNCLSGKIEIFPAYAEGLADLEYFSHIFLIYHFNQIHKTNLKVVPFMDDLSHGIFATRSPARPNKVGLSVLEIDKIENHLIYIKHIDILNGTPILDVKPFVPEFDGVQHPKIGWLADHVHKHETQTDDGRFK